MGENMLKTAHYALLLLVLGWLWGVEGVCPVLSSLSDPAALCAAMRAAPCLSWAGGAGPRIDYNISCTIPGDSQFELTCAGAAPLPLWALDVLVEAGANFTVKRCAITQFVRIHGSGRLLLEDVTVRGGLYLSGLPNATLDRLVVEVEPGGQFSAADATVHATSLIVRGVGQSTQNSEACFTVTNASLTADTLNVSDCAASNRNLLVRDGALEVATFDLRNCNAQYMTALFMRSALHFTEWIVEDMRSAGFAVAQTQDCRIVAETASFSRCSGSMTVLSLTGKSSVSSFGILLLAGNIVFGTVLEISAGHVGVHALVSRCSVRDRSSPYTSKALEVHCRSARITVGEWAVDLNDGGPSVALTDCPELHENRSVVHADAPHSFTDAFANPVEPSRGFCGHACDANYPAGFAVRIAYSVDPVVSERLDSTGAFADAGFPLSLVNIPRSLSDGAVVHQTPMGNLLGGQRVEFECCPGSQPCEFFVSLYSCAGCAEASDGGLWPGLLENEADWQRGPCAPSFRYLDEDVLHPMATFRAQVEAGDSLALAAATDGLPFAAFARRMPPGSSPPSWCPRTVAFGPHMPSTCSDHCFVY
ncbi:hypothetical protein DIPPA_05456 [Diplonema papillatum]|nr:hypothetical protein DIPPA_05456 [Diplonema papillatum]